MSHDLKRRAPSRYLAPSYILPRVTGEDEEMTGEEEKR